MHARLGPCSAAKAGASSGLSRSGPPAMMAEMFRALCSLGALAAVVIVACSPASSSPVGTVPQPMTVEVGDAPSLGPADAKVVLVEFADFQCPYCGDEEPTLKALHEAYQGRLLFAFKQFPLSFHQHAGLAAEASLAANAQGKFWEYHDALYAHQANLARADLETYAGQLGLDLTAFRAALDNHTFARAVAVDVSQGKRLGVPATPAFYVNGRLEVGALSYQTLATVIDEELSK
jgi:protein-disulfide isomerase